MYADGQYNIVTLYDALQYQQIKTMESKPAANDKMLPGDIDHNGEINVMDSVMLARLVSEDTALEISEVGILNADVNADGLIRSDDLTALLKYLAQP